jgi:hypothetical protein
MPFKKGRSGNPQGRPKGIINQAALRARIEGDIPEIIKAVTEQAKAGDIPAAKLLLDRVLPSLKPTDQAVSLALKVDDLAASGRTILEGAGNSDITPEQAGRLLAGLGSLARIVEVDELLKRVEALEVAHAGSAKG